MLVTYILENSPDRDANNDLEGRVKAGGHLEASVVNYTRDKNSTQ